MTAKNKGPANAFEWRRYVVEEDARRRGETPPLVSYQKRRPEVPVPITSTEDRRLQPKGFTVYNRVRKGEGK